MYKNSIPIWVWVVKRICKMLFQMKNPLTIRHFFYIIEKMFYYASRDARMRIVR